MSVPADPGAATLAAPEPVIADGLPDVVIISVTYNSSDIIEAFLRALPEALRGVDTARVLVVDNSSTDGTTERVRACAPWATVIDAGGNLGYAGGINVGLRYVVGRHGVLVLNPDAVPAPGSVRALMDATETYPDTGIAVPRMTDSDGQLAYSLRREPTIRRALGEAVLGGRRASALPALGEIVRDPSAYTDGAMADWATGAAMYVTSRALARVGLWADDFFLYSEETDYALRVRDAGFTLRYADAAHVVHQGGELQRSPWLWSLQAVNRTRLYRRRHTRLLSAAYWCAVLLNELVRVPVGGPTHRAAVRALLTGHEAHQTPG